jgi:thymidylate kinase
MKKVFILDGPDGSGKTTLASKLQDIYDIPIYHLTYYNDREKFQRQFDNVTLMLKEYFSGKRDGFILDRHIFSEIAYQRVYRPQVPLIEGANDILEMVEHRAATGELEIIFALPYNRSQWFENFTKLANEREEMYSGTKMLDVYEEYLKLWKNLRYNKNVHRYDFFQNMEGKNKLTLKIDE